MRIVEVRRHAERDANEDLTARGLEQAARAKDTLDFPYDAYVTSAAKRARLTMEAFGVRGAVVDERIGPRQKPPFASFGARHEALMRGGMDPATAWFAIEECLPLLLENGRIAWTAVEEIAARLPESGRALAVSHGGTIEPLAVVATGDLYEAMFGRRELAYTEGVRLLLQGGQVHRIDIIRLPE